MGFCDHCGKYRQLHHQNISNGRGSAPLALCQPCLTVFNDKNRGKLHDNRFGSFYMDDYMPHYESYYQSVGK